MELLVELQQKNLQNSLKSQGFGIGSQLHQSSFVVDDLIPDSSGEISLTIPTWPRRRNLCTFLVGSIFMVSIEKSTDF